MFPDTSLFLAFFHQLDLNFLQVWPHKLVVASAAFVVPIKVEDDHFHGSQLFETPVALVAHRGRQRVMGIACDVFQFDRNTEGEPVNTARVQHLLGRVSV